MWMLICDPMRTESPEILNQFKKWCNKRERCKWDFMTHAQKLGVSPAAAESILATLEREGWMNEERYTKAFVHDKSAISKWPERRIRMELKAKGIPANVVQRAMEEEYVLDEISEMKRWMEIKLKSCKHNDLRKRYATLFRFLVGKGFTGEKVMDLLRNYKEDSDSI